MRKFIAEFFGTMCLTLFGCGTAAALGCSGDKFNAAYVATAAAFGLAIVAMAYSIGNVSGCHINPAVSLAMLASGKMKGKDFVGYVVAQVCGALVGAAFIGVFLGFTPENSFGTNGLYNGSIWLSLLIECVLTFFFVLTILGVTSRKANGPVAGLVIGGSLTLIHLFGIHFTGTSVNPARSIGPAILSAINGNGEALGVVWVFIVAPLVGGLLAACIYKFIDKEAE